MKGFLAVTALAMAFALTAPAALADEYSFSFASVAGEFSGNGTFDVTNGVITDITDSTFYLGSTDEGAMSLFPPNPGQAGLPGFAGNDNTFTDSAPYFDLAGFSFAANGQDYNIYDYSGNQLAITQAADYYPTLGDGATGINFNVAATPEPSSLLLLGTGLFGLAGIAFRRKTASRRALSQA